MLGVEVEYITNDWLRANWDNIKLLQSGNITSVQTGLDNMVRGLQNQ